MKTLVNNPGGGAMNPMYGEKHQRISPLLSVSSAAFEPKPNGY